MKNSWAAMIAILGSIGLAHADNYGEQISHNLPNWTNKTGTPVRDSKGNLTGQVYDHNGVPVSTASWNATLRTYRNAPTLNADMRTANWGSLQGRNTTFGSGNRTGRR